VMRERSASKAEVKRKPSGSEAGVKQERGGSEAGANGERRGKRENKSFLNTVHQFKTSRDH
jgi:hypothetical protein